MRCMGQGVDWRWWREGAFPLELGVGQWYTVDEIEAPLLGGGLLLFSKLAGDKPDERDKEIKGQTS